MTQKHKAKTDQSKQNNRKSIAGFTVVEMAIVTIIVGLVMAATAQLFLQRQEFLRVQTTKDSVEAATFALAEFRENFGRYPCPASLTATSNPADPNNVLYGIESDGGNCTGPNTSVVPNLAGPGAVIGTGIDPVRGYAVVNGQRAVNYWDRAPATPVQIAGVTPRVRIGALPFKNLNLDESVAYDGYRNRLLYAVVEHMAVKKTFDNNAGAIEVLNDTGASTLQPPQSAHFIILSPGENGAGAFNREGTRLACPGGTDEAQNCDFDVDAIFLTQEKGISNNGSTETFDDLISYATAEDVPVWESDPSDVGVGNPGSLDVALKTVGDVGIGPNAANNPSEDLQVEGLLIARDDPSTPNLEGTIESETICDFASGSTTCFNSSLIAGDLTAGGGMACATGFMVGIANGAPICQNEIRITCDPGEFVTGIDSNGELICSGPPAAGCPAEARAVCPSPNASPPPAGVPTDILPSSFDGQRHTITLPTDPGNPGGTRNARFRCDAGTWRLEASWGDPCNCTAGPPNVNPNASCNIPNSCNGTFSGTAIVTSQRICPSGGSNTTTDRSACVCQGGTRMITPSCPPGFNVNNQTQSINYVCNADPTAAGTCTPGAITGSCECSPTSTPLPNAPCPSLLNGSIPQTREFTCPGGSTAPGVTNVVPDRNDPAVIATYCTCNNSNSQRTVVCPVDQGFIPDMAAIETTTVTCSVSDPLNPTVTVTLDTSACVLANTSACLWTRVNAIGGSSQPGNPNITDPCDCVADAGGTNVCNDGSGRATCQCR